MSDVLVPRSLSAPGEDRPVAPTKPSHRVEAVDIVRGFALFGVLALNMLAFVGPSYSASPWEISSSWWDRAAEFLLLVGGESAFQSTFSFLFGLGFALQLDRAFERGQSRLVFARRMLILLGFGLIHAVLIWEGDILTSYAVGGVVLLVFAKRSARTMKWWAIGLGVTMVVLASSVMALGFAVEGSGLATAGTDPGLLEETELFQTGSFGDLVADRLANSFDLVAFLALGTPWLLAQFLAGAWFVRSGRLANLSEQGPFLRRVLKVSIPVAVVAKGSYAASIAFGPPGLAAAMALPMSNLIGGPALGITYSCLVLLGLQRQQVAARWLGHLGPVGRMALTNYLSQSIIAVIFFYGWGLGFYGRWGVAMGLVFTVALFSLQILWSRWWLQRFRFGPLEWVWRALTYGQLPAMGHGRAA